MIEGNKKNQKQKGSFGLNVIQLILIAFAACVKLERYIAGQDKRQIVFLDNVLDGFLIGIGELVKAYIFNQTAEFCMQFREKPRRTRFFAHDNAFYAAMDKNQEAGL